MRNYDPQENSRYLQYLDDNNLYGWAMSQPLPAGGFGWVDVKVKELSTREDGGYLMEVDVFHPRKLQDNQNELPFVCRKMKIRNV